MFKQGEYYKFISREHLNDCKMHICVCTDRFNGHDFFSFMMHDHLDKDMYFFTGYELHECSMHFWNVHIACFLFKGKFYYFRTFKEDNCLENLWDEIQQFSDDPQNENIFSRGKNIEELMEKITL